MFENAIIFISDILTLFGAFFILTGAVGILRFKDLYSRIHPASMCDIIGVPCILIGLTLHSGFSFITIKILLLIVFLLISTPFISGYIAKIAYQNGVEPEVNPSDK